MALPPSRRDTPPDPVRQQVKEVRLALFRLHKALVDSERAAFERREGPTSNGRFLQLLIGDPFFEWLRPMSGLIVRMDEALAAREPLDPAHVRAFLEEVRGVAAPAEGTGPASRYAGARERDPAVLAAHVELVRRLAAAGAPRGA